MAVLYHVILPHPKRSSLFLPHPSTSSVPSEASSLVFPELWLPGNINPRKKPSGQTHMTTVVTSKNDICEIGGFRWDLRNTDLIVSGWLELPKILPYILPASCQTVKPTSMVAHLHMVLRIPWQLVMLGIQGDPMANIIESNMESLGDH